MPVDAFAFKAALAQFATGVTVVTTRDAFGRPLGLTVSAFCSVSLDPPLVLVCLESHVEANEGMRSSRLFGVSVLADGQEEVSRRFAWGGPDKFDRVVMEHAPEGVLLVPGALAHLVCRVVGDHAGGDHTIWIGQVERMRVQDEARPLLYFRGRYRALAPGEDAP
jgi:flavin reductase (DIM6/NTAB) family NADH-FMN oxidoreductase RutF